MVMTMGDGHATQSQVTTTEDVKACSCGSTRILRAIEQDGDKITSADFLILAVFLKVSGVWEPMSEVSDVLKSDDGVIPLHDSISSRKAVVDWMMRAKGFEINGENWRDLAILSDKYMIDSLRKDVRNYTNGFIAQKKDPTMELWIFAARYYLRELEVYCRGNDVVAWLIKERFCEKDALRFLLDALVPLETLGEVLRSIIPFPDQSTCITCHGYKDSFRHVLCNSCREMHS